MHVEGAHEATSSPRGGARKPMSIISIIKDAIYNAELYKTGRADRSEIRLTTVGWRRDPINREDGCIPDCGNDRIRQDGNGTQEYDTPSGNREYYKVIRKKGR